MKDRFFDFWSKNNSMRIENSPKNGKIRFSNQILDSQRIQDLEFCNTLAAWSK